jgi:hypothetical protein
MSPKMESEMMDRILVSLFDFKRPLMNVLPMTRHPVIVNAKIRIAHFQLYLLNVERSSNGMMTPPTEDPIMATPVASPRRLLKQWPIHESAAV